MALVAGVSMISLQATAAPAAADLFVVFRQGRAHSGQRVTVFSGDRDGERGIPTGSCAPR
jgi:hypothetical protein